MRLLCRPRRTWGDVFKGATINLMNAMRVNNFGDRRFSGRRERKAIQRPGTSCPTGCTAPLALEHLEPRQLLVSLPTLIDIFSGGGASIPSEFMNVNNTVFIPGQ